MPTRITVRYLGSKPDEVLHVRGKRHPLSAPCSSQLTGEGVRKLRAAEVPRMPAWAACGKPHRQRRRSIERRVLPYERPVLHHTRRGCRRTGNVDDTGDVRTTTHFFLSLSLNLTLSLSKVFYH